MGVTFDPLIKPCGTWTNPAAETKSIGLPADAHAVMVFATPPRQFYRDGTTRNRLPGLHYLDNFALTRKLASVYRDWQKPNLNTDRL